MSHPTDTRRLAQLAARIDAHLRRFEADPQINAPRERGGLTTTPYYQAFATAHRRRVLIQYVSYQHQSALTAEQARAYLDWLDAGNVGTHHRAIPGA